MLTNQLAGNNKIDREISRWRHDFYIYVADRKTWFLAWNKHMERYEASYHKPINLY